MSSKYDKSIEIKHEEEGSYHRREYEQTPSSREPTTTTTYTTTKHLVPARTDDYDRHHQHNRNRHKQLQHTTSGDDDDDNFEEWTTSKRTVNHKTRQVETRVSRQLLVEDGKVIADSGPQVTTRIKEDNKVEECQKEKAPKNKSKFEALECAPESESASGRVLGEKKEIQRVSREVREENMQYHDERFKELTGHDVHRRALKAPHELITINDKKAHAENSAPRGKMVHYSNKGKKYQDTDEILEVAKLAIDGSITKEVKRTKHHEEFSEDELPDEKGEAEALRYEPIVTRSSRRGVDYVNDFDDIDGDGDGATSGSPKHRRKDHHSRLTASSRKHHDDEAFPRYEIDPLLNSLRDEDFKPLNSYNNTDSYHTGTSNRRYKEHHLEQRNRPTSPSSSASSSDAERRPVVSRSSGAVEIPEEYRVNRNRGATGARKQMAARERSFSPQQSKLSHRSSKSPHSRMHKEDASVQARLTDEEEERKSIHSSSSSSLNSHEKTTKYLQRQSNANSSRNYYYGEQKHHKTPRGEARRHSVTSSSSKSSLDDPKERMRKQGTISRDSGFKSPHSNSRRSETLPTSGKQQIYSVSSKSKQRGGGAVSPTPTSGSLGQRSVKTTTTTMSAGLADRPASRASQSSKTRGSGTKSPDGKNYKYQKRQRADFDIGESAQHQLPPPNQMQSQQADTVSLSSLSQSGTTTIQVPYRRIIEIERESPASRKAEKRNHRRTTTETNNDSDRTPEAIRQNSSSSEMSFKEDIENLNKRLARINGQQSSKRPQEEGVEEDGKRHFDYKTIIANVQAAPPVVPAKQQVVGAYNVRVIEHKSPFLTDAAIQQRPIKSMADLSKSITQLELLASNSATHLQQQQQQQQSDNEQVHSHNPSAENNNEVDFDLDQFVKCKAVPALVNDSHLFDTCPEHRNYQYQYNNNDCRDDEDAVSLASSCSLKSTRTYNIRSHNEQQQPPPNSVESISQEQTEDLDNTNDKRPAAWFFDPRDNSTTTIAPPPRPQKPETPKVAAKTEELVQARGGRSYYLELVESGGDKKAAGQRQNSVDSLHSRWNSQGALNGNGAAARRSSFGHLQGKQDTTASCARDNGGDTRDRPRNGDETRRSRQILPATLLPNKNGRRGGASSTTSSSFAINTLARGEAMGSNTGGGGPNVRRKQLPFGGPPLGNRSKSSSCLLTSAAKPSKYSIYGGLRRPNESNKPVPRLSYSRAIGPKSQRQLNAQSTVPSRYLKMK